MSDIRNPIRGRHQKQPHSAPSPLPPAASDEIARQELKREITHRMRAERALAECQKQQHALIKNLSVGFFRKDIGLKGKFLMVNQTMAEMFGYFSPDEFLRSPMNHFSHKSDDWRYAYGKLMAHGKVVSEELKFRKFDGSNIWTSFTANIIRMPGGKVECISGVVEDMTARKFLEGQLAQAQKLEAMGQLAAGIAHEINTPVQYIGDNTRFIQDGFTAMAELIKTHQSLLTEAEIDQGLMDKFDAANQSADIDYFMEEIPSAIWQSLEGVSRVVEIVRAMKNFSHPDTEDKAAADINEVIESTVTLSRNEWRYLADMRLELDPDLPHVPILQGDFKQVILNLVVNAAHAIEDAQAAGRDGKGTITVKTHQDGEYVEIRISDTGTGIPEEVRPKIFDLFFTTKGVGKGTGQGLAISRAVVVEKHGGTLTFETEMDKGTAFIIRVPLGDNSRKRGKLCA